MEGSLANKAAFLAAKAAASLGLAAAAADEIMALGNSLDAFSLSWLTFFLAGDDDDADPAAAAAAGAVADDVVAAGAVDVFKAVDGIGGSVVDEIRPMGANLKLSC